MLEAGTCGNRRRYYLDDIETRVIGGLRDHLGTPEAIAYFVKCYNQERRRARSALGDHRQSLERELATVDPQIDRGVRAIIEGRITEAEGAAHRPSLRTRRADLAAQLAETMAEPILLNGQSAAIGAYFAELDALEERGAADSEAGRLIREMIETVTIVPVAAPAAPALEVSGMLSPILQEKPHAGEWTGAG